MPLDKHSIIFCVFFWCLPVVGAGVLMQPEKVQAQWSAGASFEFRNQKPGQGVGFRLNRKLEDRVLFPGAAGESLEYSLVASFSYYNAYEEENFHFRTSAEREVYDVDLMMVAARDIGWLRPYAGTGLGWEFLQVLSTSGSWRTLGKRSFYWTLAFGSEFPIHSTVRPFLEYRNVAIFNKNAFSRRWTSRLALGVSLVF